MYISPVIHPEFQSTPPTPRHPTPRKKSMAIRNWININDICFPYLLILAQKSLFLFISVELLSNLVCDGEGRQ